MADIRTLCLPANGWGYVGGAFLAALIIRLAHAFIRSTERCGISGDRPFRSNFWRYFLGFCFGERPQPDRGGGDDFLQPAFLGFGELLVYPVLMGSALAPYIGAWLGFKVLPLLGAWSKHRNVYQRFLIGNALVLIASYWLMRRFIPAFSC